MNNCELIRTLNDCLGTEKTLALYEFFVVNHYSNNYYFADYLMFLYAYIVDDIDVYMENIPYTFTYNDDMILIDTLGKLF